jgi:hypothetical protein
MKKLFLALPMLLLLLLSVLALRVPYVPNDSDYYDEFEIGSELQELFDDFDDGDYALPSYFAAKSKVAVPTIISYDDDFVKKHSGGCDRPKGTAPTTVNDVFGNLQKVFLANIDPLGNTSIYWTQLF